MIPGQGQTVRVAGVKVGDIATVEIEDGVAVVEADIDKEYKNLITDEATALLRPKTGLKDMFIEVDPGHGEPLEDGGRIAVSNTSPDIDQDEFFDALDADTRDYLKLLINGAGKGLEGRGDDFREVLKRFEPLHRDIARVNTAVAERRRNLARLVHNYSLLVDELGDKDEELDAPRDRLERGVRRVRVRGPEHLADRLEAALDARPDQRDAREGRRLLEGARPGARGPAPGVPPARHRQPRGAAVRQGGRADRARADPAVRARGAPVRAPTSSRPRATSRRRRPT